MKIQRLVTLIAIIGLLAAFIGQKSLSDCSRNVRPDTEIKIGQATLSAEITKTDAARQKGLGGRRCLADNQAMLFQFDQPGRYSFWTKDMKFPIDIIWLSADKKVVYVKSNVSPKSYPQSFVNEQPAQYVIEMKAGQANQLHLNSGTSINF